MRIFVVAFSLLLLQIFCEAQTNVTNAAPSNPQPLKVRVFIQVDGDDTYADIVRSYLTRELSRIGDVQIVNKGSEHIGIYCVVIKAKNQAGGTFGIVKSFAITSQVKNLFGRAQVARLNLNNSQSALILEDFDNLGFLNNHYVSLASPNELENSTKEDAAKIDGADLETIRTIFREADQ